MFDVLMNGVGDAFSVKHWGTHFLVRKDDFVLAVDCPDSFRRALAQNAFDQKGEQLDAQHIDAMIITHLHGDHVNGLEMTLCYRRFSGAGQTNLYSTQEVFDDLWSKRLSPSLGVLWDGETFWPQEAEGFYTAHTLSWGEPQHIGPFEVTTRPTKHHIPAMAMKITDGDATLGYSCDTTYDEELIEWLAPCDFIIHESSLGPAHTPIERLCALPEALRNKMIVAHYPDALLEAPPQEVQLAREGHIYPVQTQG